MQSRVPIDAMLGAAGWTVQGPPRRHRTANPPLTETLTGFVLGQTLATSGVGGNAACTTARNHLADFYRARRDDELAHRSRSEWRVVRCGS
jgi:hypothetical protein